MRKASFRALATCFVATTALTTPAAAHHDPSGRLGPLVVAQERATRAEPTRPAGGASAALSHDGSALARRVVEAIRAEPDIVDPADLHLQISARGGLVHLAGRAGTLHDRIRAAQVAEGVAGVTGIQPSIRIEPGVKLSATELHEAVRQATRSAGVEGATFDVQAEAGGVVHLNGQVTDLWAAIEAVRRVPGVTAIGGFDARLPGREPPTAKGKLEVVGPTPEQDQRVLSRVREALGAAGLDRIAVNVSRGIATLTASKRTLAEAMAAGEIASRVPGVLGVKNSIGVNALVYRVGDSPDDATLQAAVERALRRRLRARIDRLAVRAADGRVFLTGDAPSRDVAFEAIGIVARIGGVHEVVNALSYPSS